MPGVLAASARGRWTGRTLRLDIETHLPADLPLQQADTLARHVETVVANAVPTARDIHCHAHSDPREHQPPATPAVTSDEHRSHP